MSESTLSNIHNIAAEKTHTSPNMWEIIDSRKNKEAEEYWLRSSTNKEMFIRFLNGAIDDLVIYGEPRTFESD